MDQEKHTGTYIVNEKVGYRQILCIVFQNTKNKLLIFEPINSTEETEFSLTTILKALGSRVKIVKFIYSEKAKKIWQNLQSFFDATK